MVSQNIKANSNSMNRESPHTAGHDCVNARSIVGRADCRARDGARVRRSPGINGLDEMLGTVAPGDFLTPTFASEEFLVALVIGER